MTVLDTPPQVPACQPPACQVPDVDPDPAAAQISAALSRMVRFAARMKAEIAGAVVEGMEMGALVVLHRLREHGPQRAGELAERLQLDPSQVSRHVSTLVRRELVVRRADPDDGRATQLVVTPAGTAVAERFVRARAGQVAAVVADWGPGQAAAFAAQLERFVAGLEQALPLRAGTEDAATAATDIPTARADGAPGTDHPHVQAGATT